MLKICLVVFLPPLLISILVAIFNAPARVYKEFRNKHPKIKYINIIIFVVLGIMIGWFTDKVDFSDFAYGDFESIVEQKDHLVADLSNLYKIDNIEKISIINRTNEIFKRLIPEDYNRNNYKNPIILSLILSLYAMFTIINSKSEKLIEDELFECKMEKNGINLLYMYVCEILTQLKRYKIAKIERLEKAYNDDKKVEKENCELCKTIFNPSLQIEIINKCLLKFFEKIDPTLKDNYLRIGIFLPDKASEFLEVVTSLDTNNSKNVITSPKDRHKERFKLTDINPGSLAVRAFFSTKPLIISNCEKSNDFEYFDNGQHNRIKSIVAAPLIIDNGKKVGVLIVDCNQPDFFSASEDYEVIYEILCKQVSSWIHHENLLKHYIN